MPPLDISRRCPLCGHLVQDDLSHDLALKPAGSPPLASNVLHSWKEIASYIGCGIRTVQRWEQYYGLPIRRPGGHNRSAVLAFADEIEAWMRRTPSAAAD